MTRQRMFIYGSIVLVLLLANLWRFSPGGDEFVEPVERRDTTVVVPDLVGLSDAPVRLGSRDLFKPGQVKAPEAPKPVVEAPKPVPKVPDPRELAIKRATDQIAAVRLIGVLGSSTGALAVFEQDGNTLTRAVGEKIIPGFTVDRIVRNEVRARHDKLGLIAVMTLGNSEPHQIIRVE